MKFWRTTFSQNTSGKLLLYLIFIELINRTSYFLGITKCPGKKLIEPHFSLYPGSDISYFGDNDSSLPQFRPGGNDFKNSSEHFSDCKKKELKCFFDNKRFQRKSNVSWYINSDI